MGYTSGILGAYIFSQRANPTLRFFEWDVSEISSPTGTRVIENGHPAFIKELFDTNAGAMEFDDVTLDGAAEEVSKVQCFSCFVNDGRFGISNLKLWAPDLSALNSSGHIEYAASGTWVYNAVLPSGNGLNIPTTLPSSPNIRNQGGQGYAVGWTDEGVSEYMYLALTVPSGIPLGQYGKGLNGDLAFRITYNWYDELDPQDYSTPPIPPVAYPYVSAVSSGVNATSAVTGITLTEPAAANGDLLIGIVGDSPTVLGTFSPPDDSWKQIVYLKNQANVDTFIYYKIATGTPDTGEWVQSIASPGFMSAMILTVKNAPSSDPIAGSGSVHHASSPADTPSITGGIAGNNLLLHMIGWQSSSPPETHDSNTELEGLNMGSGHSNQKALVACSEIHVGAGATPTRTFDITAFTWPDSNMAQILIPYEA